MAQQIEHLVKMANEIALNLGAGRDDAAAARGTVNHLSRFWTPDMRRQLLEFWHDGGAVTPVVASALEILNEADRNGSETV